MIGATDLKAGVAFELSGTPYKVAKYTHQKIGRGGASVKLILRNLVTGEQKEKTMNSTVKVNEISTTKKPLQFLYRDEANAVFMDPGTYEQVEVPLAVLGDDVNYLKEGGQANVLFWDNRPLAVDIPPKIVLKVAETAPGVKGNSATNIFKSAKLENGLTVKVPLFVNQGDKVKVDTRTGEYLERA